MMRRQMRQGLWLGLAIVAATVAWLPPGRANLLAQAQAPPTPNPGALAARDLHQGLLIAADPYLTSDRSEQKFGKKHPYAAGLLAIDVYLRNDTNDPLQFRLETIELTIAVPRGPKERLEPLDAEGAAQQIIMPQGPKVGGRRMPFPGTSGSKGKNKNVTKMADSLRPQMLSGDVVPPHAIIHGFLFFDVSGHFDLISQASLYVPDVHRIPSRESLFFFEVDLAPAARK
jgi:hypothetical protein